MRVTFITEISFPDFYDIHREMRKLLIDNGYEHEHSLLYHDGYCVDLWKGKKHSIIIRYTMRGNGNIIMLSVETYDEKLYNKLKEAITRLLKEKYYEFRVIESD